MPICQEAVARSFLYQRQIQFSCFENGANRNWIAIAKANMLCRMKIELACVEAEPQASTQASFPRVFPARATRRGCRTGGA
jgi:hypothetical protein